MYAINRQLHTVERDKNGFSLLVDGYPLWKGLSETGARNLMFRLFYREIDQLDELLANLLGEGLCQRKA